MNAFRRYLAAGLLVWVPLGFTVLIVGFLIDFMDQTLLLLPEAYQPEVLIGYKIPGLGAVLTLVVVLFTGIVAANFFGRKLVAFWEGLLSRIPLVRSIYSSAKQVAETMFSSSASSFREVVMLEYPRKGLWTLAFVTGNGIRQVREQVGEDMISVYVPTTPNPTSGFFLMVQKSEIVKLDISVDDGLKLILSTGVLVPPSMALDTQRSDRRA
ncbi:MAG: DUF502 domain-containing protein [Acidiferrobacterales bacterium]